MFTILENVREEKDIGVMVHESLKASKQRSKAAKKAISFLGQMSRSLLYRDKIVWTILITETRRVSQLDKVSQSVKCRRRGRGHITLLIFIYRQLGCLTFSLRFWPKIKQFLKQPQISFFFCSVMNWYGIHVFFMRDWFTRN